MIARLVGHLHPLTLDEVIVDVGGVGYHVHVPVGTAGRVRPLEDGRVMLLVHTSVREDAIQLFGFASEQEKAIYRRLIGVSGVGPKLGLAVLSDLSASEVVNAVRSNDFQPFTRVSGVGKKTAQRLVLELTNKFDDLPGFIEATPHVVRASQDSKALDDLRSALTNLEYKPAAIDQVLDELRPAASEADDFQTLLRQALKLLRG